MRDEKQKERDKLFIGTFAEYMWLGEVAFSDEEGSYRISNNYQLWPPESKCFDEQTGWLVSKDVQISYQTYEHPAEYDSQDLGEFQTLDEALEKIGIEIVKDRLSEAKLYTDCFQPDEDDEMPGGYRGGGQHE
jgi:hypothetical protein